MRPRSVSLLLLLALAACGDQGGTEDAGLPADMDASSSVDGGSGDANVITDGAASGCSGATLTGDQQIDVALASVVVTGSVKINGQATTDYRGAIRFLEKKTHVSYDAQLSATGFVTSVTPGTYDIYYEAELSADCKGKNPIDASAFPCNGGLIQKDQVIDTTRAIVVDLTVWKVTGAVTVKGAPLTDSPSDRGAIVFHAPGTLPSSDESFRLQLGKPGAYTYATRLLAGTYDAFYLGAFTCVATQAPCGSSPVKSGLLVAADTVTDIDLQPVGMGGTVTVNGAPLVDQVSAGTRGAIYYKATGLQGGELQTVVGPTGAPTITATMFPGTYDVYYEPPSNGECLPSQMPCTGGLLKKAMVVTADFNGSVDVPVVQVTGAVTLNGAQLPDSAGGRGGLILQNVDSQSAYSFPLGTNGAFTYSKRILPAHYDVWYAAPLPASGAIGLPQATALVKKNVDFTTAGVVDIDIPMVTISGTVTANGAAIADATVNRGDVYLTQPNERLGANVPGYIHFEQAGSIDYTLRLVVGAYDVRYAPGGCPVDGQLPCNAETFRHTTLSTSGPTSFDIPVAKVSGTVTLNGAPLVDRDDGRGSMKIALPSEGESFIPVTLPPTGAAKYAWRVVAGDYLVAYTTQGTGFCTAGRSIDDATPPCTGQLVKGCGAP